MHQHRHSTPVDETDSHKFAHVPATICHASDPCLPPSSDTEHDIAVTIPPGPRRRTAPQTKVMNQRLSNAVVIRWVAYRKWAG